MSCVFVPRRMQEHLHVDTVGHAHYFGPKWPLPYLMEDYYNDSFESLMNVSVDTVHLCPKGM